MEILKSPFLTTACMMTGKMHRSLPANLLQNHFFLLRNRLCKFEFDSQSVQALPKNSPIFKT